MKNIHILPTDKPSRLCMWFDKLELSKEFLEVKRNKQHIYITSDEEITGFENNIWVIKGDRVFLWQNTMALVSNNKPRKIILTTDQDLIKDGVQAIPDEFLEWFIKNPSCEEVEVVKRPKGLKEVLRPLEGDRYKIIIPKEEPKQETLEEVAERLLNLNELDSFRDYHYKQELYNAFMIGVKYQQKNSYSEEEVIKLIFKRDNYLMTPNSKSIKDFLTPKEWFEQFKNK